IAPSSASGSAAVTGVPSHRYTAQMALIRDTPAAAASGEEGAGVRRGGVVPYVAPDAIDDGVHVIQPARADETAHGERAGSLCGVPEHLLRETERGSARQHVRLVHERRDRLQTRETLEPHRLLVAEA